MRVLDRVQQTTKQWESALKEQKASTSSDIKATSLDVATACLTEPVSQPAALQNPFLFYSVDFSTVGLSVITPVPPSSHYRIDLPLKQTAAISLL